MLKFGISFYKFKVFTRLFKNSSCEKLEKVRFGRLTITKLNELLHVTKTSTEISISRRHHSSSDQFLKYVVDGS